MDIVSSVREFIPSWLVVTLVAGILAYWYLTKNHNYWKRAGIPYVRPLPLLGSFGDVLKKGFHEIELERYREKGRIYGAYEGRRPVINIGEADILRDIMVKDFQFFTGRRVFVTGNPITDKGVSNLQGEDWKRVRTFMTPAFSTGRIKKMTSIFIDSAQTLTGNFKKAAQEGKPLDMKRYFGTFTMDVIASSAFGTKIDSHNDPENSFVTAARKLFSRTASWRLVLLILLPKLPRLLRLASINSRELGFFKDATLKIIEERKLRGQKRNDFLQLMIDAMKEELDKDVKDTDENDEAKDIGHEEHNDEVFKPIYSSKSLSNEEVVAQCVLFFLAGYDTTASTLSFTAYELALNPDIQDRVIEEIDEAIREKGELNYAAISEMKYLDNVIAETLRKYPPATRTERVASEDYYVESLKLTIPKGMVVGIPIYGMHHDPEYYPNPDNYDPDRFATEQKATRPPFAYLPFGAGPRNCVAMRFALMEVKVCLAYVLSQCRFSTCSETKIPLEFNPGAGLMQPKEVKLLVEIRDSSSEA